jgi:hypothetical protein
MISYLCHFKCTDLATCTKCSGKFILMGSECVDSCPVGFEPDDGFLQCIRKSSL